MILFCDLMDCLFILLIIVCAHLVEVVLYYFLFFCSIVSHSWSLKFHRQSTELFWKMPSLYWPATIFILDSIADSWCLDTDPLFSHGVFRVVQYVLPDPPLLWMQLDPGWYWFAFWSSFSLPVILVILDSLNRLHTDSSTFRMWLLLLYLSLIALPQRSSAWFAHWWCFHRNNYILLVFVCCRPKGLS